MSSGSTVVVIGGGGHVGLPLSIALANAGFETWAYDISKTTVEKINKGVMPFLEEGAESALSEALKIGKLKATENPECILRARFLIVVIGTPLDEDQNPSPNSVVDAIDELLPFLNEGQIVILRSTVYPGVVRKVHDLLTLRFPKIKLAFCPERIIEGQALRELKTLPQIIGAFDENSFLEAESLFASLDIETIRLSPEEAELAKLFTNAWRYIKFAAANQFWMISNDLGVDFERLRTAISYKYPRASDIPSAGFTAGPCLLKDTIQLSSFLNHNFTLGNAAISINEGGPNYLVEYLKNKYPLKNMTIGILGMTFKANSDDIRGSLAFKLRKLLLSECKGVLTTDPYLKDSMHFDLSTVLNESDLLIIGAPHSTYSELITQKPVINIWGAFE